MGEYNRAMEKLQIALQMEPKNEEIIKEIRLVSIEGINFKDQIIFNVFIIKFR